MRTAASAVCLVVMIGLVAGCVQVTRTEPAAAPGAIVVVPPGTSAVVVHTPPWCGGTYASGPGTNFGDCAPLK
jgi:hypothetical protein